MYSYIKVSILPGTHSTFAGEDYLLKLMYLYFNSLHVTEKLITYQYIYMYNEIMFIVGYRSTNPKYRYLFALL